MGIENKSVLVVEDDDVDAIALEKAIGFYSSKVNVTRAKNGEDALARLVSHEPDLVLMDIRMPLMDGREALKKIKSDESLKTMPVVMMSTSEDDEDIEFCYRNHCNAYVVKPIGFDLSVDIVKNILNFWLKTAVR